MGTEGPCPIAQKQTLGKQLRWGKSLEPSQEELVPKPPLIPGAQGTGPGLATVSVTLCRVRVKPSSSPGGREAGQLLWVLGQRGLSTSLASPQEQCLRLSEPTSSSPNSTKNGQLVGRCEGYGPSPVLGKQYALHEWLFSCNQ